MKIQRVLNFNELLRVTEEWKDSRGLYCFRGQSNAIWGLVPSIFRHSRIENQNVAQHVEKQIYRELRNRWIDNGRKKIDPISPWKILCLAQHYGTPTRLLDWTTDRLVAVFFAVEDLNASQDAAIFAFNVEKFLNKIMNANLIIDNLDCLPIENVPFFEDGWREYLSKQALYQRSPTGFELIQPPLMDGRMKAQSSLFTVHIPTDKHNEFVWDYYQHLRGNESEILRKLIIPGELKSKFFEELQARQIDRGTLFPDMAGLGTYLSMLLKDLTASQ